MRYLLTLLLCCSAALAQGIGGKASVGGSAGFGSSAITLPVVVQHIVCSTVASPATCTLTGTTAGNAIIAAFSDTSTAVITGVSDGTNGSYTQSTFSPQDFAGSSRATLFFFCGGAGGSITLSATQAPAASRLFFNVVEVSHLSTTNSTSCQDTSNGASFNVGTTTTPSAGNISTAVATEFLFGIVAHNQVVVTSTATNSFTLLDNDEDGTHDNGATEYRIVTSAGTYTDGWSESTNTGFSVILAAFK